MYPRDIDPDSRCRLPLPKREELDEPGRRTYDSLADPGGGTLRGLRGPGWRAIPGRSTAICVTRQVWEGACASWRS